MDFGFLLYSRMTVINSAREGARAAISQPPASWATIPNLATAAVNSAASGSGLSGLTISPQCVRGAAVGGCTFTNNVPPTGGDAKPGDSIRVTVQYQYHSFFPLLFGATIPLGSEVQMVLEGT